jgi:hypothetical protein
VTAWAEPARYEWDTDDPRPNGVVSAVRPGSRAYPAAIWVYETKGHNAITHRVHRSGGWTIHNHDPLLTTRTYRTITLSKWHPVVDAIAVTKS